MRELNKLPFVEVLSLLGEERVGHVHGCAARADGVVKHELLNVGEKRAGSIGRKRQQFLVGHGAASEFLAISDDVRRAHPRVRGGTG
jgi:hypothetical protein